MQKKDYILAILVVIVWGVNFTVISLGLDGVPPMMLVAVRYIFVIFPAIFFIKKPKTEWKYIILYGFSVGVGQFACLFFAMHIGMPPGLASIILQLQAFITPFLGILFLNEKIKSKQIVGFIVAASGLILIGIASTSGNVHIPISALLLLVLAPIFWATSNIVSKIASNKARAEGHELQMLNMVVWSALVPPIPMLILAVLIDTPAAMIHAFSTLNFMSIFSTLYLAYISTVFGYGVWNVLLSKYPVSKIAPFSLLVPITGLITARIVLDEQLSGLQMIGAGLIFIGLLVTSIDFKRRKTADASNGNSCISPLDRIE